MYIYSIIGARIDCIARTVHEIKLQLKANYNPNQPRKPAGTPQGGQWSDDVTDLMNDIFDIIELLPAPQFKIFVVWRNWRRVSKGLWKLSQNKTAQKWLNRIIQRGFTPHEITRLIEKGIQKRVYNNINPNNKAIEYLDPITKRFVVRDEVTKKIIQIGDAAMNPNPPFQKAINLLISCLWSRL